MSPLRVDIYKSDPGEWIEMGRVSPGDRPGSISDNNQTGRDVYLFECRPDDSKSIIYKSGLGFDVEVRNTRAIVDPQGMEIISVLGKTSEPHELEVTPSCGVKIKLRFTHE
ncbi:MAG: hypothetical protein ABIA21_01405 [Candidatus Aenigmatarchaeota archaeon]